MAYDYEGNLEVLRRMLREAEGYDNRYPQIWDLFEDPEGDLKGLPVISASKDMDSPTSIFVEIRREADNSFKFYSYFDGKAKETMPKEIVAKIENGYGMCSSPDPKQLVRGFWSAIKIHLESILIQKEMENLEKKLLR